MSRLETMALMSDVDLPASHVREQVAATIDVVVHMARLADGRRVVSRIAAVEERDGRAVLRDLFAFRGRGSGGWFERCGEMAALAGNGAAREAPLPMRT